MALIDILTRPPRLPRALVRPRLTELLQGGGMATPGCLAVAPPGSGKTVATAQAFESVEEPRRRGWCRLAPAASGGADLVRLVAAALGQPVEDPGAGPLDRAALLLDVIGRQPTTVFVDDYDLARPEECDAVLAEVLALLPPDCRIVLCSATRPAGLVGRASIGQLQMVDADTLAFTPDEVAALLDHTGHDTAAAPSVWEASRGWATAVAVLAENGSAGPATMTAVVEQLLDRAGVAAASGDVSRSAGGDVSGPAGGEPAGPRVGVAEPGAGVVASAGGEPSAARPEVSGPGDDPAGARTDVLAALALLPAVGPTDLAAAGLDPEVLAALAATTTLLRPVGDRWAVLDVVRAPLRDRLGPERLATVAAQVAPVLAEADPVAAAGVLLDVGQADEAADLLARHASEVTPDAAVPLLYRMPPEVRRRLPPLLSAARATVEMDAALAEAERRLASASTDRERVEAQVAVGAMLVHRGQLSSACGLLESALRAPPFVAVQATAAAVGWLGLARLWAGDMDGAEAVVAPVQPPPATGPTASRAASVAVDPSPLACWVAGEVALARDDLVAAARAAQRVRASGWDCAAEALAARLALARSDSDAHQAAGGSAADGAVVGTGDRSAADATGPSGESSGGPPDVRSAAGPEVPIPTAETEAAKAASAAYQLATAHGGFDLLLAGPVHAWCLARGGRWDEAAAVADVLRRRLGPVDICARLHADLVAEAVAHAADDRVGVARHRRAVATTRRLGYAVVEATARRWLPWPRPAAEAGDEAGPGLEVAVLGPIVARVDGAPLADGSWRSRKAREVLVVLALAGDVGRSREEVIESVWPDRQPDRGRTLLRTALAEIRRVLEPNRPPGEASRFVLTRGDRIVVAARTDLAQAKELWAGARAAGTPPVEAWARFRGPPLVDEPYTGSLDPIRRQAERLQLDVADALLAADPAGVSTEERPALLAALVAAAEHVAATEPWRDTLPAAIATVAAAYRAGGDLSSAARVERLLGGLGPAL